MVYIPFASLLGFQAALESFAPKSPVQEPAAITPLEAPESITPVAFINPQPRGGSWLDKDTGSGLGEPLNVSFPTSLFSLYVPLTTNSETGSHFGTKLALGPLGWRLCALCKRPRLVSGIIDVLVVYP